MRVGIDALGDDFPDEDGEDAPLLHVVDALVIGADLPLTAVLDTLLLPVDLARR